jgi:WD40 repeat protein
LARYLILIGNSKYDDEKYSNIIYVENDIKELNDFLRKYGEFDSIKILLNENFQFSKEFLEDYKSKLKPNDEIFLYFSGHGEIDQSTKKINFIFKDTLSEYVNSRSIGSDFFLDFLIYNKAKSKVFILDCCYSGAIINSITKSKKVLSIKDIEETHQLFLGSSKGVFGITSSRKSEVSYSSINKSLFTECILNGLKSGKASYTDKEFISMDELWLYIDSNFDKEKQVPRKFDNSEGRIYISRMPLNFEYISNIREKKLENNIRKTLAKNSREMFRIEKRRRDIVKFILPDIKETRTLNIYAVLDNDDTAIESVMSRLQVKQNWHGMLLGDGGMGKTTSLMNFWSKSETLNEFEPILLYIPLNEINLINSTDEFIQLSILQKYMKIKKPSENDFTELWNEMNKKLKKSKKELPGIVLLLDGYNEVDESNDRRIKLDNEIKKITGELIGTQVIITSRFDLTKVIPGMCHFNKFELLPLEDWQIKGYLKEYVSFRKDLFKLLRNPMMLTMYARSSSVMDEYNPYWKKYIETPGEILFNFVESELIRIKKVYNCYSKDSLYRFTIYHIMSYIGWFMESQNLYSLDYHKIEECTKICCKKLRNICFNEVFNKNGEYDFKSNNYKNLYKIICTVNILRKTDNGRYEFIHQNFRDYFAACYIVNEIKLGIYKKYIPNVLKIKPMDYYVLKYIGEILGEHYNNSFRTDVCGKNIGIIESFIDILREIYDDDLIQYTLWNIIEIIKIVRKDLSGIDLSKLNLKKVSIMGIKCNNEFKSLYANFDGSIFNNNFIVEGHSSYISCIVVNSNGDKLISGSWDKTIKIWDINLGECINKLTGHDNFISALLMDEISEKLVSGSWDKTIKVWDTKTGKCLKTLREHTDNISSLLLYKDGKKIISGSWDKTIKVWDIKTGECLKTLKGHSDKISSLSMSDKRNNIIISGSWDKTIKIWDIETGKCIETLTGHEDEVSCVVINNAGNIVISSSGDKNIKIWNIYKGECIKTLSGHIDYVCCVAVNKNEDKIVSGSRDKIIKVWDINTGMCIKSIEGHSGSVSSIVVSKKGERIISCSGDKTIKIWNINTGECIKSLEGHYGEIGNISLNQQGNMLINSSSDNTIKIWDIKSGKCIKILDGHEDGIVNSIVNDKGDRIVSVSTTKMMKIWDINKGICIKTLKGFKDYIWSDIHNYDKVICLTQDNKTKVVDIMTGNLEKEISFFNYSKNINYYKNLSIYNSGQKVIIKEVVSDYIFKDKKDKKDKRYNIDIIKEENIDKINKKVIQEEIQKEIMSKESDKEKVNKKGFEITSLGSEIKICDLGSGSCIREFVNIKNLFIIGCSFKNLKENISDNLSKILKMYGANID